MIRWALDIPPRGVAWVLPGYLARGLAHLLASPRGSGKSLAAISLGADASAGGPLAGGAPQNVLINSLEDALDSVLRPRLEVAGADLGRVALSAKLWQLPDGLAALRAAVEDASADLVILDSLAQHVPGYQSHLSAQAAMRGLVELAQDLGCAVLLVAHTLKAPRGSVEASIGGAGVVQALSKAIYLLGRDPSVGEPSLPLGDGEGRDSRRVLACERIGIGPVPPSLAFELETVPYPATGRNEARLRLVGESPHSAQAVLEAIKGGAPAGHGRTRVEEAAEWLRELLEGSGPMPTEEVVARAKGEGVFHSRNTFDRARQRAGVESVRPADLRAVLGDGAWEELPEERTRQYWVRLPAPAAEQHRDGSPVEGPAVGPVEQVHATTHGGGTAPLIGPSVPSVPPDPTDGESAESRGEVEMDSANPPWHASVDAPQDLLGGDDGSDGPPRRTLLDHITGDALTEPDATDAGAAAGPSTGDGDGADAVLRKAEAMMWTAVMVGGRQAGPGESAWEQFCERASEAELSGTMEALSDLAALWAADA